jgi:hypothetical protein
VVLGWQHTFRKAEDELDVPRSLALPDWATLSRLADALVARSSGQYRGWGDLVLSLCQPDHALAIMRV